MARMATPAERAEHLRLQAEATAVIPQPQDPRPHRLWFDACADHGKCRACKTYREADRRWQAQLAAKAA